MNRKSWRRIALGAFVLVIAGTSATLADRHWSSTPPLVYSGLLTDGGRPLAGPRTFSLVVYDRPQDAEGARTLCEQSQRLTVAANGYFELHISDACREAMMLANASWYELSVDGTTYVRQAIGAVPYAYSSRVAQSVLKWVPGGGGGGDYVSGLGSVCGMTAPTNGSFSSYVGGEAATGLRAAKKLCERTCQSPSAHICVLEDLFRFEKILGRPATSTRGWVTSSTIGANYLGGNYASGRAECARVNPRCAGDNLSWDLDSAPYTWSERRASHFCRDPREPEEHLYMGYAYGPNPSTEMGWAAYCDETLPILCCD